MRPKLILCTILTAAFVLMSLRCDARATPAKLTISAEANEVLDRIYSGDVQVAIRAAQHLQQQQPAHPLGYLLETEALWWKIWCTSADFKYGMTNARHRPKLASDQHYFQLAAKVSALAQAELARHETPEMQFYAGMGNALQARLYGLRWEGRNAAHAGVRAREHLLRAIDLDPALADADFGLGLYNYYVDTLSAAARVLRFFMGLPGGNKQLGIRQLEHSIQEGVLTPAAARFYLAINLHNYDQQYARALEVISPLVEKYPSNPIFRLVQGDLYAKLNRKAQAIADYHAAADAGFGDPECQAHIRDLVSAALAAVDARAAPAAP
jgi:tetratricopeptide (TPR) repeat protein